MPNFTGKSGGGPTAMKMYGAGKNPIMMTKAQETLPEKLKAGIRAKEAKESNSPIEKRGKKGTMAKKDFDFEKTMDLNVDRYGPSATQTNLDFTKKRDFSQEAIDKRRNKKSMAKMYGKHKK